MNDIAGAQALAEPPSADAGLTAGALLRRAREAAGLHVAALAVSLKVPVRKLEALEEDRWDLLPDAVFVRALASSVCRSLKIDPQPVLQRLPQTSAPRLVHDTDGINTPFRAPSDGAGPTWLDQLTRPVFLAVFALLLGALVLILLPSTQQETSVTPAATTPGDKPAAAAPVAAPAASNSTLETVQPNAQVAQAPAAVAAPAAPTPVQAASAAAAPVVPAASAAANAPPTTVAGDPAASISGMVIFRTKAPCWVEVTDAKGVVAVRKLLGAGETAGASGALPLQVTVGRVDAAEVQVRGKPFDLRPVTKDNVARFEVK